MKKKIILIIGIIISLVFLYLSLKNASVDDIWGSLERIKIEYLLLSEMCLFLNFFSRGFLLRKLLSHLKAISPYDLFKSVTICGLFNNIYPLKLGEVAKAYYISKTHEVSFYSVFSSVITERLIDMLILIGCFFGTIMVVEVSQINNFTLLLVFAVAILGLSFIYWITKNRDKFTNFVTKVLSKILPERFLPSITTRINYFLSGFYEINNLKDIIAIFIFSMIVWVFTYFHFVFGVIALDININYFVASLVLMSFINLSAAIPNTPGMIGTLQFMCISALYVVTNDNASSNSNGLVLSGWIWFANFSLSITFGLYYLLKNKINFKKVMRFKESEGKEV